MQVLPSSTNDEIEETEEEVRICYRLYDTSVRLLILSR